MLSTQLINTLKQNGKLSDAQVTELSDAAARGEDIVQLLVSRKIATTDELMDIQGKILGLPTAALIGRDIPQDVLTILPQKLAERLHAIAFERNERTVTIGLVDPTDQQAVEAIEFLAREQSLQIRYAIISPASFEDAFRRYGSGKRETAAAITAATEKFAELASEEPEAIAEAALTESVEKAPVSKIVSVIIRHAVEAHASDIHIEPFGKETRLRYRIDGVLKPSLILPGTLHAALVARIKVLASLKLDETRIPQDGRIRVHEGGHDVDLRVSTLPLLDSEKVVMRILESEGSILTLKDLGFRDDAIARIDRAVHRPNGMVLLTGPTGSGKSTTLYAVLSLLNREGVNIVTLEDPIEYYARGVNQAQIRAEVGFTFAAGLRAILRQDPNVIMVGEIRDTETAELAIHAGLTGHLLFSTLHTRDVLGVVPRLIDMKVEP
ncbi:type II/IV secretion system protein, partial [Candidatus Uhrbacteria bacterium]|nr:type II/IV secretion system protein [Candidatus Uhrbacteria bacterium]